VGHWAQALACVILLALGCADDPGTPPPPPPAGLVLVKSVPVPERYGIHDTFVRDGVAFVLAWDTGVIIYDVGNGMSGGTPANPVRVSQVATTGGQAHNAWWFHNPNTGERRYLFVGEEGGGTFGSGSSGDIHVLDVSDLRAPVEVAFYHRDGAGPHNFWMDEAGEILYAAYYNAGVVALDVSDTLAGNLAAREITAFRPGGSAATYTWGVQLANGGLYAIDMYTGLWRLTPGASLTPVLGGNNVPDRYSSDFWVHGGYAYSGTWGAYSGRNGNRGNALKVWRVDSGAAPVLVDSVIVAGVSTLSDVQVSEDGALLVVSAEGGAGGLHVYGLADPAHPAPLGLYPVSTGLHTVTLATITGRRYAFGAKNPRGAALMIFDLTEVGQ
jgi:hypothetical protein